MNSPGIMKTSEGSILHKIQKTIRQYHLFYKGEKVLLACSGGPDSMALLHLFLEIRKTWDFKLFVGHYNHGLRQAAEKEEALVRTASQKYSIPFFGGSGKVRFFARKNRMNLEEAARILRYDFLRDAARKAGCRKIATGHTMNDQAETVLMWLLRGCGLHGLTGIHLESDSRIVRPMIHIGREEILEYLKQDDISFCIDESNLDLRYVRNRIRLKLLPYIRENFEPQVVSILARTTEILTEEEAFLQMFAKEKACQVIRKEGSQSDLDAKALAVLPVALSRRIIREFIGNIQGSLRAISLERVEAARQLKEGKEIAVKDKIVLRCEGGRIFLKKKPPKKASFHYRWSGEQALDIRELSLRIQGKMARKLLRIHQTDDKSCAFFDREKLSFPLTIRSRKPGDIYHPLGAPGRKKLKEIMRAKQIPVDERSMKLVFQSGEKICWVQGLPVSEKYKVTPRTKKIWAVFISPL